MYLLQKVFQLRDKANPEMEKPFLDHLEDLRHMITRVLITLVIAVIACFGLQKPLMEILRKPAENVWAVHSVRTLPPELTSERWERAKEIEAAAAALGPELRESFLANFDATTRDLVESTRILRAANLLAEPERPAFYDAATTGRGELRGTLDRLIAAGADPAIGQAGDLMRMSALRPTETFMLSMKLAFFAGVVVSFPFLLFFILQFVLPGLHLHEKKVLWPAMTIGFGLFILGVCFAYFIVLPRALVFFFEWGIDMGVANDWRIGEYISFATQFTLLFGLSFELPVVVMVFVKLGMLSYEMMSRTRSYAVLAIIIIAACITPTSDIITLAMMALPMYLLYEACIWLAWYDERKQRRAEEKESREHLDRLLSSEGETDDDNEQEDRGDPPNGPTHESRP